MTETKGIKQLAVVAMAAVVAAAAATEAENPYGACAHITRNEPAARTCVMMRQAGMGWVRADFDWRMIENNPGVWDFSECDKVVAECEAAGMQMLPIIYSPPKWAEPTWEHLDKWEGFVRKVVERYGKRLPVLEVWNEQNCSCFWHDHPNATNYLAVLRRTHETVKKIDPAIRVAFGGTAGIPFDFIEQVYRLGGASAFDIMNIHPYTHPYRPEGEMDTNIEKLRALMAKYGDGKKPLWITEVGWPTHRIALNDADVLLAGLRSARPDAKKWRMLYIPAQTDIDGVIDESMRQALADVLPKGSSVENCRAPDVAARLGKDNVDAVVYPFSEDYAADSADAVFDFVKAGGVLIDFGGLPMYKPYRMERDGKMHHDTNTNPANDRRRLRIAEAAWWMDARYPKSIVVNPTDAAAGVTSPPKGFECERFFTDRLLKPGDKFIPLLSAHANGIDVVGATVYKFGSDMKGAIVVSGLLNTGRRGTSSEERQSKMCARSLGIAFAEGVERFFWYEFRQPATDPSSPNSYFGLVHDNFAPKPALGAYMTFVDTRPAGSVQNGGEWRSADGKTYFPQWTRPDGRKAGMIWTIDGEQDREVTFSSRKMTFLDASGAKVRPTRNGCEYSLRVTDSPLYFFGGELRQEGLGKGN